MAESGYNINDLVREAQLRWLKPAEILFILQNHENHQLSNEPPQKPPSGSLFLFNKRVLRFFRKDGHSWRKKKDGRTVGEAHERLKVGNAEALNCYYAHGEQNPNFQRRSYWMLDHAHDHIVLVHYRDITEGRQNPAFMSESSPISSAFSPSPSSYSTQQTGSTVIAGESYEQYQNQSSPGEICSDAVINNNGMSDITRRTEEVISSPGIEMSQALRRLEEQLSLNDDSIKEIDPLYADALNDESSLFQMQGNSNSLLLQPHSGESSESHDQDLTQDGHMWKDMLDDYGVSAAAESQTKYLHKLDENAMLQTSSERGATEAYESYKWPNFSDEEAQKASVPAFKQIKDFKHATYPPEITTFGSSPDQYTTIFDQDQIGTSLEDEMSLTIAQKQKFTIRDISPDWGYSSEATKVVIIGSFLCNPSESTWTCMFGDIEVPVQIIQEGVICCQAPLHLPGKVTLCVTSSNRESCSEVREFEYRVKPDDYARNNQPDVEGAYRSTEELLLLVRFVQLLLSDLSVQKGDSSGLGNDFLEKSKASEDSWAQVIESLLFGTSRSMVTIDWLLQELLKDKFQQCLSCKLQRKDNQIGCSLSKKEQGIIHMVAGLGFEWALHPILNAGVSVNFRDINGWTGLHWAARFGREKMVASLIASGASAGAVTDPSSRDPVGKTAASIASSCGHKGLAGYLSEVALTSHLSSLTFEESELSKGTADVEAEKTISSISNTSTTINEDQCSLKDTLAAVRNAAQAAAGIQSAFRAHSFRKRQQRESVVSATASGDEYGIFSNDIQGLSAASKFAFRNTQDSDSAALAIQKKYRGWKGRRDFLAFRRKVVKIQAHVRGYQVRKQYKVCWAVGILEKVVLRWRRRGVGLRGFRHETEPIDESEDEDILKVFRRQKVDAALDEAVSRVLSMVESPGARQQYHRILEKYRQAKAELEGADSETASAAHGEMSSMENDDVYQFPSY
ncbi:calmodulin-binding transcription activator 4-like isoform X1 [Lycium barbarum]|uniref:calmodulin-binding transcription activator 4-like isoform X1 n=1 Tax=Lycium barbarum TaxID=112863 RepID=UPI00293E9CD7|nr:calmodulin-binding transcription activator 4-like isoform X1 [Lycium barbarum]